MPFYGGRVRYEYRGAARPRTMPVHLRHAPLLVLFSCFLLAPHADPTEAPKQPVTVTVSVMPLKCLDGHKQPFLDAAGPTIMETELNKASLKSPDIKVQIVARDPTQAIGAHQEIQVAQNLPNVAFEKVSSGSGEAAPRAEYQVFVSYSQQDTLVHVNAEFMRVGTLVDEIAVEDSFQASDHANPLHGLCLKLFYEIRAGRGFREEHPNRNLRFCTELEGSGKDRWKLKDDMPRIVLGAVKTLLSNMALDRVSLSSEYLDCKDFNPSQGASPADERLLSGTISVPGEDPVHVIWIQLAIRFGNETYSASGPLSFDIELLMKDPKAVLDALVGELSHSWEIKELERDAAQSQNRTKPNGSSVDAR